MPMAFSSSHCQSENSRGPDLHGTASAAQPGGGLSWGCYSISQLNITSDTNMEAALPHWLVMDLDLGYWLSAHHSSCASYKNGARPLSLGLSLCQRVGIWKHLWVKIRVSLCNKNCIEAMKIMASESAHIYSIMTESSKPCICPYTHVISFNPRLSGGR